MHSTFVFTLAEIMYFVSHVVSVGTFLLRMQGARNEIFAMQPAPIQVSYMGFPGTTGATYIDYLVTDEVGEVLLF